jgi:hypothetical protein
MSKHLISPRASELTTQILATAARHGLVVAYLCFQRGDIAIQFDTAPTTPRALPWLYELGAEVIADQQYPGHVPGTYDRVLRTRMLDDGERVTVWVRPDLDWIPE